MTLRTRMLLAFVVLAVVPMAVIVVVSYSSSIRAFRSAVESQGRATADEMNRKVARVSSQLDASLATAAAVASDTGEGDEAVESGAWLRRLSSEIQPLAPLVEAAEFVPSAAPPAAPPAPAVEGVPPDGDGAGEPGFVFFFAPEAPGQGKGEESPEAAVENPDDGSGDDEDARKAARAIATLDAFGKTLVEAYEKDPEQFQKRLSEDSVRMLEKIEGLDGLARQTAKLAVRSAVESEQARQVLAESARVVDEVRKGLAAELAPKLRLSEEEQRALEERRREAERLLGRHFRYEVREGDRVVGHLEARVRADEVVRSVLGSVDREGGEIPFAVDQDGRLYAPTEEEETVVEQLRSDAGARDGWVLVERRDEGSGVTFGIARPVGEGLEEIRRTAMRNLGFGLGLIGLAAVVMVPLSRRMTRRLGDVTAAAGQLATGDLSVRVPEGRRDEVGRLARAFNRMAAELDAHQRRLLEEQRLRQEDEVARRVLEVDHARKSRELEEARLFQLSLLPDELPEHETFEIAVAMRTATEVGGDYYDVHGQGEGPLTLVVGDATGHGAAAGTMVTVAKSLFSAASEPRPAAFLEEAAVAVRRMSLERMCMALQVVRLEPDRLSLASAGMPPALVWRRSDGAVDEILLPGLPVGAAFAGDYREVEVPLAAGDLVLLMSDGFPELPNLDGEPLGYDRVREAVAEAGGRSPQDVVRYLLEVADRWRGDDAPPDDMTFLAVRVREA